MGIGYIEMFKGLGPHIAVELDGIDLVEPDVVYDGEAEIDLGGRLVRLTAQGPAHTVGDQTVLIDDRVLFTGDMAETRMFPIAPHFPPHDADVDITGWIAVMDRLITLDPAVVVPGHGEVTDVSLLRDIRDYLRFVQAQANNHMTPGRTSPQPPRPSRPRPGSVGTLGRTRNGSTSRCGSATDDPVLVTSRSAAEYRAMFDLSPDDLAGVTLDCCAGGASFAAETPDVVAVDPAYAMGIDELGRLVRAGLHDGDRMILDHRDRFEWSWYGSVERRRAMRMAAAEAFLADLRERPGRYVAAALPALPLASKSVDLALCSHLLFTWANRLDEKWHRQAIEELVRVARQEVRIFPLVLQGTAEPVGFLDRLRSTLPPSQLREVPYRFQRGARHMLVVDATGRAAWTSRR
ncbi:MBL fold metallo-hydrolase [Kutzneria sp. NPDC052558]|uniref:MBL fold metallo-hydrolase n=1 Tax=Kutzneria sp. NPDC052558 TaxID=3364121 RepID=UPI0037C59A7A